jgi:hypothetical protein
LPLMMASWGWNAFGVLKPLVIKAVGCTCLIDIRLRSMRDIKIIHKIFCIRQIYNKSKYYGSLNQLFKPVGSRKSLIRFEKTLYILNDFGTTKKRGRLIKMCMKCMVEFVWVMTGNVQVHCQERYLSLMAMDLLSLARQFMITWMCSKHKGFPVCGPQMCFVRPAYIFFNILSVWRKSYRITENTLW